MYARQILIAYGTSYGQTARIAERMADQLAAGGDVVTVTDCRDLHAGLAPGRFDGILIGASIIGGRYQRRVHQFVRKHRALLDATPSAFFSVCGSAASTDPAVRAEAQRYIDVFLEATGWQPELCASIAGSTAYTKYNPFLRWIMKRITARRGGPTDTTRDHEQTDWAQVRRFVEAFAVTVPHPRGVPAVSAR